MPTKTQRILGYLPGTFRAAPLATALKAVVDAPGRDLLAAENSLAALMRAHWVDHADRGAEEIDDLARIAALYGLAPRDDEDVETFREHLKRYVRTFLEGTVTVQGILRVTAEALGLSLADGAGEIDFWWDRPGDELVTREPAADDAAEPVLGVRSARAAGRRAEPARVAGSVDLAGGVDLGGAAILRLKVDAAPAVDVDVAAAATLDGVVAAVAAAAGPGVASHDGRTLTLASPVAGAASRLEVREGPDDAAPALLGLLPREVRGEDPLPARLTGRVDLAAGADLSAERYLRLRVDGTLSAEVDCAGAAPAATTLDEIAAAVNGAFGQALASHDGRFLTLTSPSTGLASSLAIQRPAAQDVAARLFGPLDATAVFGRDARPARVVGTRDLAGGVDLSARSQLRLRIDQAAGVVVDCAGEDPAATTLDEIVAAINGGLGAQLASHDGRFVTVASTKLGAASRVAFLKLAEGDAGGDVFGVSPRTFTGSAAVPARLAGTPDLSGGVNVWARKSLQLAATAAPRSSSTCAPAPPTPRRRRSTRSPPRSTGRSASPPRRTTAGTWCSPRPWPTAAAASPSGRSSGCAAGASPAARS